MLLIECLHELADRRLVVVEVVRIKLQGETAALRMMQGSVPVAADSVIRRILSYIDELRVGGETADDVHRTVRRIVIDHYDIVRERSLLRQSRTDGVSDSADAVAAGDHDRSLNGGRRIVENDFLEPVWCKITSDGLEVLGAGLLHLYLDGPVARIHIVKLLFAGLARIGLHVIIAEFRHVDYLAALRNLQPQVIQAGKAVIGIHRRDSLLEHGSTVYLERAEIEVVTQRTGLQVDDRMGTFLSADNVEAVCIDHRGTGIIRHLNHSLKRIVDKPRLGGTSIKKRIFGFRPGRNLTDGRS